MQEPDWLGYLIYAADLVISLALSVHILMRKRPTGVTVAWLLLVVLLPFVGAVLYLLFGENRLDEKRLQRARDIHQLHREKLTRLEQESDLLPPQIPEPLVPIRKLAVNVAGFPAQTNNSLQLLKTYGEIFESLIQDIDSAERFCHLQFYIWHEGGFADAVADALVRACERGVVCRVQLDAVGSKPFLRGKTVERLRSSGVEVNAILRVGPFRILYRRADLRNHRKIVVIDNRVAYTGSQNLVDPRFFKQDQGVGEWIDVMVRMQGPSVEALDVVFIEDWQLETGRGMPLLESQTARPPVTSGGTAVQVVASGPVFRFMALHQLLTTAIYAARDELIITTPYFVPDEPLNIALVSAARRGVSVTIIVPRKVDSILVRHVSRSMFDQLLEAGVKIAQFYGGLLHTKTITVDGELTIVGSVNMDMRSLWLNFEISLFVYDRDFTEKIVALSQEYLKDSGFIDAQAWRGRPRGKQFVESVLRLTSPLL